MFRISLLLLASLGIAAAQAKVAIINTNAALSDTAEIKKASAELEARLKPDQTKAEQLQKELADIQTQLQTGAGKLSQEKAQELQATGTRRQRELQRLSEDLQAAVERERADALQQAGPRMEAIIKQIAEARGLDVVIDVSNAVYFKPGLDITQEVVAAYDKAHPVAAAASAAK